MDYRLLPSIDGLHPDTYQNTAVKTLVKTDDIFAPEDWAKAKGVVIVNELGKGGQGKVFKVIFNGNEFALKIQPPIPSQDEFVMTNGCKLLNNHYDDSLFPTVFRDMNCGQMRHKNIIVCSEIYSIQDGMYGGIFMPCYPTDMRHFINDNKPGLGEGKVNPYSNKRTLEWIKTGFDVLQFLNDCGIVHGDIKPDNIMIDVNKSIIFADFGSAYMEKEPEVNPDFNPNGVFGTRWYRAPEMFLGSRSLSAVDMWMFGVTMLEVVMGKAHFMTNYDWETLLLIFKQFGTPGGDSWAKDLPLYNEEYPKFKPSPVDFPKGVNNYIKRIILCMLKMDPSRRLRAVYDLQTEVRRVESMDRQNRDIRVSPKRPTSASEIVLECDEMEEDILAPPPAKRSRI